MIQLKPNATCAYVYVLSVSTFVLVASLLLASHIAESNKRSHDQPAAKQALQAPHEPTALGAYVQL